MSEEKREGEEEFSSEKLEIEVKDSKKSKELEQKQKELEERLDKAEQLNADVVQVIDKVAQKEFEREKQKVASALRIDPDLIEKPEDLKAYEKLLRTKNADADAKAKGTPPAAGTPITAREFSDYQSQDQSGIPIENRTYASEEELVRDLEHEEKKGDKTAKSVLDKMARKMLKKGVDLYLQGNLPKIAGYVDRKDDRGKTKEQLEEERRAEENKWKESD